MSLVKCFVQMLPANVLCCMIDQVNLKGINIS